MFQDLELELNFLLGTGLVIAATFLYGMQSHSTKASPLLVVDIGEMKKETALKETNERSPLNVWNPVWPTFILKLYIEEDSPVNLSDISMKSPPSQISSHSITP